LQKENQTRTLVIKRSIVIGGHKTSVSLEDAFWQELKRIAGHQRATLSSVISNIDMAPAGQPFFGDTPLRPRTRARARRRSDGAARRPWHGAIRGGLK